MWIATRRLYFRGTVYNKGDQVPCENSKNRHALEITGRIARAGSAKAHAVKDEVKAETAEVTADLKTMKRDELNAHAAELGIENPEAYPNKDALIEAIGDPDKRIVPADETPAEPDGETDDDAPDEGEAPA